MTGREKILAAFTPEGTPQVGAATAYEDLFIRDHYADLTQVPWWDSTLTDSLATDFHTATGLEWFCIDACASREERSRRQYEHRSDGIWWVDRKTGEAIRLQEPISGGANTACSSSRHMDLDTLPTTIEEIDMLIPRSPEFDRDVFLTQGRHDAAISVHKATDLFLYTHIQSPVWSLYNLFGYEGMMVLLAENPDLVVYASERQFEHIRGQIRMAQALGADAVWIEECLTDQIRPEVFWKINVPLVGRCAREIRTGGMKSIYYYCGNPAGRLDAILAAGADGLHVEESKKGFHIDLADIVKHVHRRCSVFGNLDVIGILEKGSDRQLRFEVERQLDIGRSNGNRFVMSTGSPITPHTSVQRVRQYTDLVRNLTERR